MKFLAVPAVIAIVVAGWWWFTQYEASHESYSGTIEAEDVAVGSKLGGRVVAVEVKEGDVVQAGTVLVRLEKDVIDARMMQARAELTRAEQRLLELENGPRPQETQRLQAELETARQNYLRLRNGPRQEEIRSVRASVELARAEVSLASRTVQRQQDLLKSRTTSEENYDRAKAEYDVARSRLLAAQAELDNILAGYRIEDIQAAQAKMEAASSTLDLALEGTRQEQIAQARAEVDRIKAELQGLEVDAAEATIATPSEAIIESCRLQPGDLLAPHETAAVLLLFQPLWVRIYIPESRLGRMAIGQELPLTVVSLPGKTFKGRIMQIHRQGEFTPRNVQTPETRDDLVFGIKIEIDDPRRELRPGMVADIVLPKPNSNPAANS